MTRGSSGNGQDARRVVDRHLADLALPHRGGAQRREEVLLKVDVAEAAVRLELRVVADVLAEQQLRGEAAFQQLDDRLDQSRLVGLLNPEPMPQEAERQGGD